MVRRRRNESNAALRVADGGNLGRHLVTGQVAAFARLGTLRHFYLQFIRCHQVKRGDAEAAGCDLLCAAIAFVAVAFGVFSALA